MQSASFAPLLRANPVLHEIIAAPGHAGAATGFALAVAGQMLAGAGRGAGRGDALLWVHQDTAATETGAQYAPGLAAFGIDPGRLVLARLRTPLDVLRAGLEGARCPALGAVIVETTAAIDFTASRRLKLAAEKSGVRVVSILHADVRAPTAAGVRWRVGGARSRTGDRPTFDVTLLKHPDGCPGLRHVIEWDREQRTFVETLSEPLAAVSDSRPLAA